MSSILINIKHNTRSVLQFKRVIEIINKDHLWVSKTSECYRGLLLLNCKISGYNYQVNMIKRTELNGRS